MPLNKVIIRVPIIDRGIIKGVAEDKQEDPMVLQWTKIKRREIVL